MNRSSLRTAATALALTGALSLTSPAARAAVIYDEATAGDFSSISNVATPVGTLPGGSSVVTGALPQVPTEDDQDVFAFQVGAGTILNNIYLSFDIAGFAAGFNMFFNSGTPGSATSIGALSARFLPSGTDLLGTDAFSTGPLSPGSYYFDLRAIGSTFGANSYAFDFRVAGPTAVPEPAGLALFGIGMLGLGLLRRRTGTRDPAPA